MASNRVKYAYVNYGDIQERIDSGGIDQYDIVLTKDTHEQYLIKEDLTPLRIISKVYCFNSVENAKETLNASTDTYEGQIIAIADNELGVFHGYIVNKSNDEYTVTSLADSGNQIDYNALAHRPVINKTGTLANPLIVGELDNGLYSVSGEYKIFTEYPTVFSSSINHLFVVEKDNAIVYVKDVSAKKIVTYILSNGEVTISDTVTIDYLKDNKYITENDFNAKIEALDYINKSEVSEYVTKIITEYFSQSLDDAIDKRINNYIADDSEIDNLFQ